VAGAPILMAHQRLAGSIGRGEREGACVSGEEEKMVAGGGGGRQRAAVTGVTPLYTGAVEVEDKRRGAATRRQGVGGQRGGGSGPEPVVVGYAWTGGSC
jgi:hypothetical protein